MRHIPSRTMIARMLGGRFERERGDGRAPIVQIEGRAFSGGADRAMRRLRQLLEHWKDGDLHSDGLLDLANSLLNGHGVECMESQDAEARACYVNLGETYETTLLLDLGRERVWLTSWGDWLEAEERAGHAFA